MRLLMWLRAILVVVAVLVVRGLTSVAIELPIPYSVERNGRVSLAIYDSQGRMVRTLLTGAPRTAGTYVETWDGLDRYGRPLPTGTYRWKCLGTEGLRAEFIAQVGQNVDPLWERATGNHEAPRSVAIDATGLYRVGATNEGAHWGVKTDLEGRHVWVNDRWSADPWAHGTVAVTLVSDRLFELMPNGHVYGYDASTGRVFTGGDYAPKPWDLCWSPSSLGDVQSEHGRRARAANCPHDMAGDPKNNMLVASYPQFNIIAWFSAKDGTLIDSAHDILDLAGIAVSGDGTVFAISQAQVVAFSRNEKTRRVIIDAKELDRPWRLCVSAASGDIFVAENSNLASRVGTDTAEEVRNRVSVGSHHQVKRFTADGTFLQAYGRPEGRSDGRYIATDFRGLTDIEADHIGGFVITEGHHTPPRRSARFASDGTLLREWYGAQHYGVIVGPEPEDPRFLWARANADQPGLIRYEIDYSNKSWRVAETYQLQFRVNPYYQVPIVPHVIARDNRIFIHGGGVLPGGLSIARYDPETKQVRPCNASGTREHAGRKQTYLWNDLNDDGLATDDEVQWLNRNPVGGALNPADFTLLTTPHPTSYQPGHRITPARFTIGGTPVYQWEDAVTVSEWEEDGQKVNPLDFRQGDDGSWYGCYAWSARNPNESVENHGAWYYNSCSAIDRLVKWDSQWNPIWSVGRHSPDNDHETGSTAMPRGLVGFAHGCVVWGDASDEETCRPTVWTEDGLYVDELLRVPLDSAPKEVYGMFNANEYPMGHIYTDPDRGETFYYALNSGGGSPIYRISGWDGWQQKSGTVELATPAAGFAQRNGTGLKAEYFDNSKCEGEAIFTRTDPLIYFNWGSQAPDPRIKTESFSVRWTGTYEASTEEVTRFEVRGGFPWRDRGRPLWTKLWLGGQLVLDSQEGIGNFDTVFNQDSSGVGNVRVKLRAGERIDLRLECGFQLGQAAIALSHDTPNRDRRAIPSEFLYPEPTKSCDLEIVRERRPEQIADFGFEEPDGVLFWSRGSAGIFGRATGAYRRVEGKSGRAIELVANGEFAPSLLPIDEELRLPDTDYTVSFWFKTACTTIRLCEAKRYSSYNNRWSDHVVSVVGGKLRFQLQGDAALEMSHPINDDQWHCVVTTVGPGGQRLYCDGTLAATGRLDRRTNASNRLGLDLGPGDGNGVVAIDELEIFGRCLLAQEISARMK